MNQKTSSLRNPDISILGVASRSSLFAKANQIFRYAVLLTSISMLLAQTAFAQSTINWESAQNSMGAADIDFFSGSVLYALNGSATSTSVGLINFETSKFNSIPSGVSFTPTGSAAGSSFSSNTYSGIYGGGMVSTGDTGYDQLLDSFAYTSGVPGGVGTGEFSFSGLTPE